jgi:hypothetical protein
MKKEGAARAGRKLLEMETAERHLAREYSPLPESSCHMRPDSFVIRFSRAVGSVYSTCTEFSYANVVATIHGYRRIHG